MLLSWSDSATVQSVTLPANLFNSWMCLCVTDWLCSLQEHKELSVKGEDGRLYHWILPSFFQLLKDLVQEGREFAILFRTFGTDLPRVLRAVHRALNEGAHPLFPDLPDLKVKENHTFSLHSHEGQFAHITKEIFSRLFLLFPRGGCGFCTC